MPTLQRLYRTYPHLIPHVGTGRTKHFTYDAIVPFVALRDTLPKAPSPRTSAMLHALRHANPGVLMSPLHEKVIHSSDAEWEAYGNLWVDGAMVATIHGWPARVMSYYMDRRMFHFTHEPIAPSAMVEWKVQEFKRRKVKRLVNAINGNISHGPWGCLCADVVGLICHGGCVECGGKWGEQCGIDQPRPTSQ
jgi:hypothetical protein